MTLPMMILLGVATLCLVLMLVDMVRDTSRRRAEQREIEKLEREDLGPGEELEGPRRRGTLSRRLSEAGIPFSPVIFLIILALVMAVVGIELWGMFAGAWIPPLLGMGLVAYVILSALREIGRMRAIRFEEKLVDAVDLLVVALRAGENPEGALHNTARASPQPVQREFDEVVKRLRVGMPLRRALGRMQEGYDSEGVRLFTNTLNAKWRTGGDLAPVLQKVARIMRERLRYRLRIQSQMAGAKLSAFVVAVAPYVVVVGFYLLHPAWLQTLFRHPLGPASLFFAICLQFIGFIWLTRLARIEL